MQSSVLNEETEKFIRELEEKLGSPLGYRTFCTWYSDSEGNRRERGVFLCRYGDSIHYEDFEVRRDLIGDLLLGRRTSKEPYVKFERSIALSDIVSSRVVRLSAADKDPTVEHREAGALSRPFSRLVVQLRLKDSRLLFFEVIDRNEFLKALDI